MSLMISSEHTTQRSAKSESFVTLSFRIWSTDPWLSLHQSWGNFDEEAKGCRGLKTAIQKNPFCTKFDTDSLNKPSFQKNIFKSTHYFLKSNDRKVAEKCLFWTPTLITKDNSFTFFYQLNEFYQDKNCKFTVVKFLLTFIMVKP